MEIVTQAVNDELMQSLDYKLATSNVNYVQSRRDVQYYPSSLSTFTPTTSRVARIPLTSGMDFIDPESVKIAFRVRNNDATSDLFPGTLEPSCFIKRVQLYSNGQRTDDISEYGRRSGHPRRRVQGRADGAHADRALPKREDVAQPAESGPRAGVRRGWGRPAPGRRHLRFQHRERARLGLPSDPGQCASGVLQQGAAVGPFPGLLLPDHAHPGLQRARGRHQP